MVFFFSAFKLNNLLYVKLYLLWIEQKNILGRGKEKGTEEEKMIQLHS